MKLDNKALSNFVSRIKLRRENMAAYREQLTNLRDKLKKKIEEDERNAIKVTKFIIAGSYKKHTILRRTGDHPIDIDLILYVAGDSALKKDLKKLHDFVYDYLQSIYPGKDIDRDVDMEGNTKSIKIKFVGSGLEVDIVPVVPLDSPEGYVFQPERGGGGTYTTSIEGQLAFAKARYQANRNYNKIVRILKWWRNHQELKPELSSFAIELIVAHLDISEGVEENIEEAVIRFFRFVSDPGFPVIQFSGAINSVPGFQTPVFIAEPTNNENNSARKTTILSWTDTVEKANDAFESLNYAVSRNNTGDTIAEWKRIFGPTFNIEEL
ncbi:CBASS oligonucleotide cyclase [Pedobacter aquatilis]|uniref:CBASS oligonucleotide cyclase n=1 Tax=Pedobacter aquatilis TaxID=351343 RepID=UPI0025B51DF9|nr:CBASS oligonucleotide cyclase [Pedobacter aquatilis]MDN3586082.1 CBASS oligonucleotide cyclase [Pedobacter aquatilis]